VGGPLVRVSTWWPTHAGIMPMTISADGEPADYLREPTDLDWAAPRRLHLHTNYDCFEPW
jgi:hypothetical protein